MPVKKENLRTTKADNQPDVKISFEQLLEELDREHPRLPDLEDGDFTRKRYADAKGIAESKARGYLDCLVEQKVLEIVYKRSAGGQTVATYRKAEQNG